MKQLQWKKKEETNGGKSVAGIGNQQAGFADSTVADRDALYEPGRTHFRNTDLTNFFTTLFVVTDTKVERSNYIEFILPNNSNKRKKERTKADGKR